MPYQYKWLHQFTQSNQSHHFINPKKKKSNQSHGLVFKVWKVKHAFLAFPLKLCVKSWWNAQLIEIESEAWNYAFQSFVLYLEYKNISQQRGNLVSTNLGASMAHKHNNTIRITTPPQWSKKIHPWRSHNKIDMTKSFSAMY